MMSDADRLRNMLRRVFECLERSNDIQFSYRRFKGAWVSRILYPDMVQLTHIIKQLQEMQRYWEEVLGMLERGEPWEWQEACLRDAGEKEKEG